MNVHRRGLMYAFWAWGCGWLNRELGLFWSFCVLRAPGVYSRIGMRDTIRAYKQMYTKYTMYTRFSLRAGGRAIVRSAAFKSNKEKIFENPACFLRVFELYYLGWLATPAHPLPYERRIPYGSETPSPRCRGPPLNSQGETLQHSG